MAWITSALPKNNWVARLSARTPDFRTSKSQLPSPFLYELKRQGKRARLSSRCTRRIQLSYVVAGAVWDRTGIYLKLCCFVLNLLMQNELFHQSSPEYDCYFKNPSSCALKSKHLIAPVFKNNLCARSWIPFSYCAWLPNVKVQRPVNTKETFPERQGHLINVCGGEEHERENKFWKIQPQWKWNHWTIEE